MENQLLKYCLCGCLMVSAVAAVGQNPAAKTVGETAVQKYTLSGVVYDETKTPVADAIITTPGHSVARTDADGRFVMKDVKEWATVKVTADGYYAKEIRVNSNTEDAILYLVRSDKRGYNETELSTISNHEGAASVGHNDNLARKDFAAGVLSLDQALQGQFSGLQVTQKSGMTGEGSYLSLRGIRSLVAENAPLVVINGVPFLPDDNMSTVISGYSRSIFQAINPQDIANVTLLKGAEAAAYGSLGSNGVLLIETDGAKSDDLNTRITFTGSVGVNWNNNRLPMMNSTEYKSYLSDIAMDYYGNDMTSFFNEFPFMQSATANNAQLYQFNTNWQDEVMQNSFSQDYMFRVEGGDAIAKYNISLGYTGDEGTLTGTQSDRYNAQINAAVLVSKQFEINAAVNLAYLNGTYQEQGYSEETNPLLAAYRRSPLLSPYKTNGVPNSDGSYSLLSKYSNYYFGSSTNTDFIVSNPLAIVNSVDASIRQYDVNAKLQLTYRPSTDWTFNAIVGLYSNYDKEKIFIPGVDNSTIVPLFDQYGEATNTVRVGQANTFNMYYSLNGQYHKLFNNRHDVTVKAAYQVLTTQTEYDLANGRNSANDFYQTMGDANGIVYFTGYNNAWNWANGYISADYTYGNLAKAGIIASVDGASSTGKDVTRAHIYPGAHATLMLGNTGLLRSVSGLNQLDLYADYSVTGNSQYSSKLGQYYYTSSPFMSVSGIVRANVPNTRLTVEKDKTFNAGLELTAFRGRVHVKGGFYQTEAEDVLMLGSKSSALGSSAYYTNDAAIRNRGLEVSAQAVLYSGHDFRWTVGGQLSTLKSEVTSLGGQDQIITTLSDGAEIITRVGSDPYAFYGYKTNGVYATTREAKESGLSNRNSVAYSAGDVRYVNIDASDNLINDNDKVLLGSATPDFYGSFFTTLEYKNWALDLNFVYSQGNKAYNAMRRITESASDLANQSKSVTRRWQNEGDITDMPRANYGDVVGNNDFSDRFVEDASYVKLRDVTLSYTFHKKVLKLIQGGTLYVSGQNLLCFTDYLGLDPEFSYSTSTSMLGVDYGKVALPKTVKVGVKLNF